MRWIAVRQPGLQAVVFLILSVLFVTDAAGQAPFSYFRVQTNIGAAGYGDVSWIDADADGDQDLLLVAATGPGSRLPTTAFYRQISTVVTTTDDGVPRVTGEYDQRDVTGAIDLWLSDIDWADYDRDGDLDAAVSGTARTDPPFDPVIQIYEQTAPGVFRAELPDGVEPVLGVVRWADIDGDGDADLLVSGSTSAGGAGTRLYRNDAGTFELVASGFPDVEFGDAAWADLDRDGDFDLAICGARPDGRHVTAVFLQQGDTYAELNVGAVGLVHCSVEWGDYDQDGFPDLLVSGGRPGAFVLEGRVRLYRNDMGRGLVETDAGFEGVTGGSARWVDTDNDGALDVITNGGRDLVFGRAVSRIYRNEGGRFRLVSNISGTFPGRMSGGDFDGDGDIDLVMVGAGRDGVPMTSVMMNGELVANSPPTAPSGLESEVSGDRVFLSWAAALDEQTPSSGLTYNLRLGTEPGAGDIVPSPSGSRDRALRSVPGAVGSNQSWTVRGLANGTYYWSVQAVDNSYSTSTFAAEATFQVTASSGTKPVAGDERPGLPGALRLGRPYPNPVSRSARIDYEVPRAGPVRIDVFDATGRLVATLADRDQPAGRHSVDWRPGNGTSGKAAAGVYLVRLSTSAEVRSVTVAYLP